MKWTDALLGKNFPKWRIFINLGKGRRNTRVLTRRWTGAADPVGIKWKADWRPPGQLRRYLRRVEM
jgi:hypothetical protein